MVVLSEIKYRFEQLLSEIYAVKSHRLNQVLVLNQDQRKISSSVKIVAGLTFICSIIKILHSKYSPFCDV